SSGTSIAFGGLGSSSSASDALNDEWAWSTSGGSWSNQNSLGLATVPSKRYEAAIDYDAAHAGVFLFGGTSSGTSWLTDTWKWNGSAWSQVTASGSSPSLTGPGTMAYDSILGLSILFFGPTTPQTWTWNASAWTNATSTAIPTGRSGQAMVYDSTLDQTVLFGGSSSGTLQSDTWV